MTNKLEEIATPVCALARNDNWECGPSGTPAPTGEGADRFGVTGHVLLKTRKRRRDTASVACGENKKGPFSG